MLLKKNDSGKETELVSWCLGIVSFSESQQIMWIWFFLYIQGVYPSIKLEKVRTWSSKQSNVCISCHGKVGFKFVGSSLASFFFPHHSAFILALSTLFHAYYKMFTIMIWYRGRQFPSKMLTGSFIADGPPLKRSFFVYFKVKVKESIYHCRVCKACVTDPEESLDSG